MRDMNAPGMTPTEFEVILRQAADEHLITTDTGADGILQAALDDVAGASERDLPAMILRARILYAHQARPTPSP